MNIRKIRPALLAAAILATAASGTASAAPAADSAAVRHARCNTTAVPPDRVVCLMSFAAGRDPGDVHIVIRTSERQRVAGTWWVVCGAKTYGGGVKGRTTVRRHLLGQARSARPCRMATIVNGARGGSITVVITWVKR